MTEYILKNKIIIWLALFFLGGLMGLGGYYYYLLKKDNNNLLQQKIKLEDTLVETRKKVNNLSIELGLQQTIVKQFTEQVEGFADTVGTLEKLSRTDPELLKKYSKIYFLNEHYVPEALAIIDDQFMHDKDKPVQVHLQVWPYLRNLLQAALTDGVNLSIVSGYRSFGIQSDLKSVYRVTYGAGSANQFSADQGYSEHQLGTTVDFTTTGLTLNSPLIGFDKTKAYQWLTDNAHRFGFILSYPSANQYYVFEPWHWRFVGVKLATWLKDNNQYFYDIDQRQIDQYLVNLFD